MCGPAVRDDALRLAGSLEDVLEPEAGAADVGRPRPDRELVVEPAGGPVADVGLDGGHVDTVLLDKALVAAGNSPEVCDPRDLEPDEVHGVMDDALGVGLAEANPQIRPEAVAVHLCDPTMRR